MTISPARSLSKIQVIFSLVSLFCFSLPVHADQETRRLSVADWRNAVELVQGNRPRAAIPVLEQFVALAPENPVVQAELGIAYARARRDAQAVAQLKRALSVSRDPRQQQAIQSQIDRIRALSDFGGSARFGIVPQTNITRSSSLDTIRLGDLEFILDNARQSGTGLNFDLEGSYGPMIAPDLRARAAIRFSGNLYENRDANDYSLQVSTGLESLGDRGRVLGIGVLGRQRWAADSRFSVDRGIYANYQIQLASETLIFGRVELVDRKVPSVPRRNATAQTVSLGAIHLLDPQTRISLRGSGTRTRAQVGFESGRYHSLGFGIRRAFESGWQADANIDVSRETRDGIAPAFGVVRSETTQKLTLQITNRNVQYRGFSPVLQLGAERRRSNIEIYSYQNRFLGVSLSRGF